MKHSLLLPACDESARRTETDCETGAREAGLVLEFYSTPYSDHMRSPSLQRAHSVPALLPPSHAHSVVKLMPLAIMRCTETLAMGSHGEVHSTTPHTASPLLCRQLQSKDCCLKSRMHLTTNYNNTNMPVPDALPVPDRKLHIRRLTYSTHPEHIVRSDGLESVQPGCGHRSPNSRCFVSPEHVRGPLTLEHLTRQCSSSRWEMHVFHLVQVLTHPACRTSPSQQHSSRSMRLPVSSSHKVVSQQ